MDLELRGKWALVTGASKGIGAAVAQVLAEEGCHLHLAARNDEALTALAESLQTVHGVQVEVHVIDLRNRAQRRQLADNCGTIDILVNNAGDIPGGTLQDIDEDRWRQAWELKVFGYIDLTRAVYARMQAQGHGAIVNIIGLAGERFDAGYIAGSSANAALMAFTRALGGRSMEHGIRVAGINPGSIRTDRIITLLKTRAQAKFGDESRWEELAAQMSMGQPREIADVAAFLASKRASYVSGAVLAVDGGAASRVG